MKYCPKCWGIGWKAHDVNGIGVAVRCDCLQQGLTASIQYSAHIPDQYRRYTFENFRLRRLNSLRDAATVAWQFAKNFSPWTPFGGLLIYGAPGVGKTHLAVATLNHILHRNADRYQHIKADFKDYRQLLQALRSVSQPGSAIDNSQTFFDRYAWSEAREAEILLLDDVGASLSPEAGADQLFANFLAARDKSETVTIVTTRCSLNPAEDHYLGRRLGEKAASLLLERCRTVAMPRVPFRVK